MYVCWRELKTKVGLSRENGLQYMCCLAGNRVAWIISTPVAGCGKSHFTIFFFLRPLKEFVNRVTVAV